MAISPLLRPLGITSALLASCQGLTWSVLTLMGILIYTELWIPELQNVGAVARWMYVIFLTDIGIVTDLIMTNKTMIAFISVYFALSLLWMVISLCMLWVVIRKKWEYAKCTLIAWSTCTGIISILDIVTMSLFAVDYDTMLGYYNEANGTMSYSMVAAVGVMMTIAARGFLLLIVNIIFTVMFGLWGYRIREKDYKAESDRHQFINAFSDNNQSPVWMANGANGGLGRPYSNHGFEIDGQHRQTSLNQNQNRYGSSSSSPPPLQNLETKIGRNNPPRTYLEDHRTNQPRGPYIPAPDYSPPSLQKHPKSVLKSRSQY